MTIEVTSFLTALNSTPYKLVQFVQYLPIVYMVFCFREVVGLDPRYPRATGKHVIASEFLEHFKTTPV